MDEKNEEIERLKKIIELHKMTPKKQAINRIGKLFDRAQQRLEDGKAEPHSTVGLTSRNTPSMTHGRVFSTSKNDDSLESIGPLDSYRVSVKY